MRNRKRVHAIRRGPDGSAFQTCEFCRVTVAIALSDMHECDGKRSYKKSKVTDENLGIEDSSLHDQPRSPFRIFMEKFRKTNTFEDWFEIDRRGFEKWKNMSNEERLPFVLQARQINSAYEEILLEEMDDYYEEDDEADSATVQKFNLDFDYYYFRSLWKNTFESFDS